MTSGYRVPPLSRAVLRDAAIRFRQVLGLADHSWFPIVEVYEWRLPEAWEDFHFEIGTIEEMGDDHALAYPAEARVVVREDIYDRACNGEGRDRLTLAHELGHVVLQHSVGLARSAAVHASHKAYEDSEWQATAFGAELLMRVADVKTCRTPDELAARCGVSVQAAITQRRYI